MSDDILRGALTLGGAYFFGPGGALLGGLLGDILFPQPGVQGPRLQELQVQHSTVGAPIPIFYGTVVGAGNVIWSGGLIETKHTESQGGKFGLGGTKVSNYTYAVDVAIGICEGPISGIRRIWADADLIYDASDDATLEARLALDSVESIADAINAIRAMSAQLDFTLYLGDEDQLPDPTIESYEVAGTTPAYRGLAYIVFNNFQLANFGNRIPNFRFEVYSGTATECGIYSPGTLYPWVEGGLDPRNPLNNHIYQVGATDYTSHAEAAAALEAALGKTLFTADDYLHGWQVTAGAADQSPCGPTPPVSGERVTLYLLYNVVATDTRACVLPVTGTNVCDNAYNAYGVGNVFWRPGSQNGLYVVVDNGEFENQYFNGYFGSGSVSCADSLHYITDIGDEHLEVRRSLLPPSPCAYGTPLVGAPGYCVINGQIVQGMTWTQVSGSFHVLQAYDDNSAVVQAYPVGPAVISTDPLYNDQDYWEAAYAEALANGEPIAGGKTYGVDYPQFQSFAFFSECDTVDAACVPMAVIVADICRRAGLRTDTSSQIDVSDLTTCVIGYAIGSQMSARDALQPLRRFGLWDAVESGEILRFVERGHALVATLTADDLGAHEYDSQPPSAVETSRLQEKDLPRRVRVHFPNYLHDHESSEQPWSRLATEAVDELDINLPIVMEPDTAAQLAEILLYAEYVGRNTYRLALDNDFLDLEATDCIEVPVDGQTERMMITSTNYKIGGILEIEARRDDDGSYVSTRVAAPTQGSGAAPGTGGSNLICPSEAVLLDIPRIRDIDIDAGYYAAIYSTCGDEGWTCAELYRSDDDGLTYGRVARTDLQGTVGTIDDISGPATDPTLPGDSPAYDAFNTITVTLFNGELATITDAQIAVGQNLAAVGIDGRWVLIQYKTVTLSTVGTYVLSDLIWGLNDTQHLLGSTIEGDTFVLLSDAALLRIPENPDAIGVEKTFKAVTCGEALDAVTPFQFTTWGLSYQRLCPSDVISATTTTPPVSPIDGDSYLLPNDTSLSGVWALHGGEIATWSDETDSWVYCTPAPGTIIHVGGDSSDPGDDVIAPGGGGTPTAAPWTPAIPPLLEDAGPDPDLSYFVIHTPDGYRKILMADAGTGTGGGGTGATGATGIGGSGNGGMVFVDEAVVTGAAATDITISGLDLAADETYLIEYVLDNSSGSTAVISVYYNGDFTAGNYDFEFTGASGGSVGSTGSNSASISSTGIGTGVAMSGQAFLRHDFDGRAALIGHSNTVGSALRAIQWYGHTYRTVANVTSITFRSSVASALSIGSFVRIYSINPTNGGAGGTGGSGTTYTASNGVQIDTSDDIQLDIPGLTAIGALATNDTVAVWDVSAAAHREATISQVVSAATGVAVTFIDEIVVSGGAVTSFQFTGLDLDADQCYMILLCGKNANASVALISLFYNGDTTAANYDRMRTTDGGTGVSGNDAVVGSFGGSTGAQSYMQIHLQRGPTGRTQTISQNALSLATSVNVQTSTTQWVTTGSNVTQLDIVSDIASAFDNDSTCRLFRISAA